MVHAHDTHGRYDWGNPHDAAAQVQVEAERATARATVRNMQLRVVSKLFPGGQHGQLRDVSFVNGLWRLDGQAWAAIAEEGVRCSTPIHPPPEWAMEAATALGAARAQGVNAYTATKARVGRHLLHNDAALRDAVTARGAGVVDDAAEHVRRTVAAVPMPLLLRALATLRQQFEKVTMPVPSRYGGMSSDDLMAYVARVPTFAVGSNVIASAYLHERCGSYSFVAHANVSPGIPTTGLCGAC